MEDIAEDTVIHQVLIALIRFFNLLDYIIIKCERTIQIAVDGCRRQAVNAVKSAYHFG